MHYLDVRLIVIGVLVILFSHLSLLFAYLYVTAKNRSLRETKNVKDLSGGILRFLRKHNYSREIILEKLKSKETRLFKMRKPIILGLILLLFYFVSRTSQGLLMHYYFRRDFDFLNSKDFIMLLVANFVVFTVLWRKIVLITLRIQINELSRLLEEK